MPKYVVPVEAHLIVSADTKEDAERVATSLVWDFLPDVDSTSAGESWETWELKEDERFFDTPEALSKTLS